MRISNWLFHLGRGTSLTIVLALGVIAGAWAQSDTSTSPAGPVRLRSPATASGISQFDIDCTERGGESAASSPGAGNAAGAVTVTVPPPKTESGAAGDERLLRPEQINTFEGYLRKIGIQGVRRFGIDLVTPRVRPECLDGNPVVPPDYMVATGDELVISMWGSVDADLRVVVDRSGRISIPRVGPIMVSGVPYGELPTVISRRAAQVFKNFQVSVTLGQMRGVRIYVTGYVKHPGAYTVNSLSTIVAALLRAGGPTDAGSLRTIQLRRGKSVAATFDLYDLLTKGDRSSDRLIQADDTIFVGPVGPQVALIGAVNKPAIFELKAGERLEDVLSMAGGFGTVADRSRMSVERLADRATQRVREIALPAALSQVPEGGDVYRIFSAVDTTLPVAKQTKRVRVEGEVARPGDYVMAPGSSIEDALKQAGGLTQAAFVFGTEFTRESVRVNQQENYDRALRDLETEFARANTQRSLDAGEAAALQVRTAATQRLIERMRALKPTGRIVLQMEPEEPRLPNLELEDGDRLYIPPVPTSVGVFGSVFNGGSYLFDKGRNIAEFLGQAGGPTRGADASSTFVIRANGSVVSNPQKSSFFGLAGGVKSVPAQPGDTIFVPEEINKTTWTQDIKEWTQIMYQFGLGAAALKSLKN